jgi:hypothetical protein
MVGHLLTLSLVLPTKSMALVQLQAVAQVSTPHALLATLRTVVILRAPALHLQKLEHSLAHRQLAN